ncbi:DUF6894 family protein [Novosphingobium chloroacetimidivorans]|uniref:DUF6894 family protein n=1 Tax=Novosphingobium chloroacetimidivorans TaxID=1428314 RepID=UPI0035E46637
MPRYQFEIRSPSHLLFSRRVVLDNLAQVGVEASARMGELLQDQPARLWTDEHWELSVCDDDGVVRWVIEVIGREADGASCGWNG